MLARREHEVSVAERAGVAKDALDITRPDHVMKVSCPCGTRAMKIHDVTLTIGEGMTTWGGEPGPELRPLRRIANGDSANVSTLTLGDHTGTHVDPPLHFIDGGATAEQLPLDALIGPCTVVAYEGGGTITGEWLERAVGQPKAPRILFKTRNSALWSDPRVLITPHIASMTQPETAVEVVLENLRRHRAGEPLLGLVDRRRSY